MPYFVLRVVNLFSKIWLGPARELIWDSIMLVAPNILHVLIS